MVPGACRKLLFLVFFFIVTGAHAYAQTEPGLSLTHNCGSNITLASDYYACGNDLVDQGNYDKAISYFRTARSMDSRFFEQYHGISYQIGWLLNRQGKFEESLAEFQKSEKIHPEYINDYAIYYNEGCLLAKLGRNEEAVQKFDQALVIEYYNWYAWFNKGIILARMGRYSEAKDAFEKAKKARGSYVPRLGSYREAANTYLDAAGLTHSPNPASNIAIVSPPTGVQPAPTYISGLSVDLQIRKASDLMAQYRFDEAIWAFDQALVNDPTSYHAMEGKGVALANLGRFEEAVTTLDRAILYLDYHRDASTYVDAWAVKGWALANLGKYNDSVTAFDKALVVEPDSFSIHYDKAWVLAQQNQYAAAAAAYNRSLDWENQQSLSVRSTSILGALGTYQDAADAMDRASSAAPAATTAPAVADTLIYQTDFSNDPHWQTDRPRQYYWDSNTQAYHFISDENLGYAEMPVAYNDTSFRMEYDITIPHADPGTVARIGLSKYNKTYDSDNAIMAEFRSWRAGTYRSIKDGDKTYQIIAVDSSKHVTNEEYEGACRINREDSIANATYGEGRIYHVVINYDRDKDTVTTQVTDNFHTRNYYVCSGIWSKLGFFRGMDRIILVVREEPNAYIEGYIDNVKLYSVNSTTQPSVAVLPATTAPTTPPAISPVTSPVTVIATTPPVTPEPAPSPGPAEFPVLPVLALVIAAGAAGAGFYFWKHRDQRSPDEIRKEKAVQKKALILGRSKNLEFHGDRIAGSLMECDRLLDLGRIAEAEALLKDTEKRLATLEKFQAQAAGWKAEGFDTSPLCRAAAEETIAQEIAGFENRVGLLKELGQDLDELLRRHPQITGDATIARRIEWIRKNLCDTTRVETVSDEIRDLRATTAEYEKEVLQEKSVRDERDYIAMRLAELSLFPGYAGTLSSRVQELVKVKKYDESREILKQARGEIEQLKKLEAEFGTWNERGYTTDWPAVIPEGTIGEIRERFDRFRKSVNELEENRSRYQTVKKTYPVIVTKPEFAKTCSRIEQALIIPGDSSVPALIRELDEQIRHAVSLREEVEARVRFQAGKVTPGSGVRPSTLQGMEPVKNALDAGDYETAQRLFDHLARNLLDELNNRIDLARKDGILFALTADTADSSFRSMNYGDAVIEAETRFAQLDKVTQVFSEARDVRKEITDPALIAIFDRGNYAEFTSLARERAMETRRLEAARRKAGEILIDADRIGRVPASLRKQLQSDRIGDIEILTRDLEEFMKTARPRLELTLDRTRLDLNVWHRATITIRNLGEAHALDVNFTFSPEFDTRWIRPKNVPAGETVVFEDIGLQPKIRGEVPLEISLRFHDGNNTAYTEKSEFFITVTDPVTPHTPHTPRAGGDLPVPPPSSEPDPRFSPGLRKLYRNEVWLGKGGFAYVFRAVKILDEKVVAVKVPISIDASTGKTFVTEMQNWTKMVHENIVRLYDYNIMPVAYFEMELCDESLARIKKPISNEKAAWFLFHICEGLKYAHGQGIIHRDLKPQNILLKNGVPKISDWGLSRVMASQSSTVISGSYTLYYAAPEQVNKRRQDIRTDIWQLGIIFYELTTGILPFKEETVTDTIIAIATKDPVPPSRISPEAEPLDAIVMRCLEKDPAKRYQTALDLQKDLGEFLRMNYCNSLNESIISRNYGHTADFCSDLIMVNLKTGNLLEAYKYTTDLAKYMTGDLREASLELAEQLRIRIEAGVSDIQDELIQKADLLVHRVKMQRR